MLNNVGMGFDRLVLRSMHLRMPLSFGDTAHDTPTLDEVLAETTIDRAPHAA
jgi:hypothetical protein